MKLPLFYFVTLVCIFVVQLESRMDPDLGAFDKDTREKNRIESIQADLARLQRQQNELVQQRQRLEAEQRALRERERERGQLENQAFTRRVHFICNCIERQFLIFSNKNYLVFMLFQQHCFIQYWDVFLVLIDEV